ncbi:hint-domain-containing protein [Echria macrotheca]|uniref:Hint-domain-containing protein n=1 Tax=Echria macrotheca TaxID=438768 RepID=A0AAJ0BAB9_9PEZI|nr:hint-domain-containing protein [Echria macrotheca]
MENPLTNIEYPDSEYTPELKVYPLPSEDGLLVKIRPPSEPLDPNLVHVPCDIVLVIDVSASMSDEAPVPSGPGESKERNGLSVLDLTKHAARTVMEPLNERDRLGIVTFSDDVEFVQELTPMEPENKRKTGIEIENLEPVRNTNLWAGIKKGIELFNTQPFTGNVPALMVLTDGYIPMLRDMGPLPATIHTFGFGYKLKSGLLKSIAEIGGGNYSFIPDAGMIGTVFVHAVANLQSTYATNTVLRLSYPATLGLEETTGESVEKQEPIRTEGFGPNATMQLTISLGNIQYGHPRDIYLRYNPGFKSSRSASIVERQPLKATAALEYKRFERTKETIVTTWDICKPSLSLTPSEIVYQVSRSALITYLSSFSSLQPDREHMNLLDLPKNITELFDAFLASLPASAPEYASDPFCQSLINDLCGPMRTGQVAVALSNQDYYRRWGRHYFPSLACAHARQICNSFKDPGPLMYGKESPLFIRCRDSLDKAFDSLPAPKPSLRSQYLGTVQMKAYNRSSNPCFAEDSMVSLATGTGLNNDHGDAIPISTLRPEMMVLTPRGPRKIIEVLKTPVKGERLCLVGEGVLVTPWHPVLISQKEGWVFPKHVAGSEVEYTGSVYSVLLERDRDVDAHAIKVGELWGVTLGHGMMEETATGDVRTHQFFGNYERVVEALGKLPKRDGLVLCEGVRRNVYTDLVDGFNAPEK